jgi:hypothetical protein
MVFYLGSVAFHDTADRCSKSLSPESTEVKRTTQLAFKVMERGFDFGICMITKTHYQRREVMQQ